MGWGAGRLGSTELAMHFSRVCGPLVRGHRRGEGTGTRPAVTWRWQQRPRTRLPAPLRHSRPLGQNGTGRQGLRRGGGRLEGV